MKHIALVALVLCLALALTGCSAPLVSGKRFGSLPEPARDFVQPDQVKTYSSPDAAWQALETGYQYETDEWYIADRYGQMISGGSDTWLMPSEVQQLIDITPHSMDCEDGAIWLASALKKQGLNAWLCVGSVTLSSGTYGHAWTMVLDDGGWTLYETTTGQIKHGLPPEYHLSWRTNGQSTFINIAETGSWMNAPQIPPDLLSELRNVLGYE